MKAPPHNMPLRYNVCPTDLVDVVPGAATASASWCRYLALPHQCANSGVT